MLPMSDDESKSHLPSLSREQTREIHRALGDSLHLPKPRPAIRRAGSSHVDASLADLEPEGSDADKRAIRQARAREAHERGKRLEDAEVRVRSEPTSRYNSPERTPRLRVTDAEKNDIPMQDLSHVIDDGDDSDSDAGMELPRVGRSREVIDFEAHRLVRKHTRAGGTLRDDSLPPGARSGAVTPTEEQTFFEDYRPKPDKYRGGVLGALLDLYKHQPHSHKRSSSSPRIPKWRNSAADLSDASPAVTPQLQYSPPESGAVTPSSHWYSKRNSQSTSSLAQLVGSSASLGSPVVSGLGEQVSKRLKEQEKKKRPGIGKRSHSASALAAIGARFTRSKSDEEAIKIKIHIAETIARQKYLSRLCKALMVYGAPTHRLEEYMRMSARVLEIEAQFLYIPGSMIMSFDDPTTHTTEVKLIRVNQGLDLGKLRDVHEVYKDVVHDRVGVEEATIRLKEVTAKPQKHNKWFLVFVYGLAAVCVGPFAFGARLIDLPIAFILGCILGLLQLVIAPKSDLYANVFEIAATVITSFLARAFGSIPDGHGGRLFCFSALAQSSIALILPGYTVLCASLELQSRSIVAGSVRMVYAIIYSLFLGYGITIGTAMYGIMDSNATSATTCSDPIPKYWFFFFVPGFTLALCIINLAKWKQVPVMMVIAFAGYVVNYFSSRRFAGNTQVSNTLGALVIGVMANLYSRVGARIENKALDLWEDRLRAHWKAFQKRVLRIKDRATKTPKILEEGTAYDGESIYQKRTRRVGYGLAAAAMLPAIFVQVPSGLAVSGSLISGIASANQIAGNATNGTQVVNSTTLALGTEGLNSVAFNVGYSVIQVAIGITVGLFLSAIIIYPLGKKRSGLFSF